MNIVNVKFFGVPETPVTTNAISSLSASVTSAGSVLVSDVVTLMPVNPVTSPPFFWSLHVTEVPLLIR